MIWGVASAILRHLFGGMRPRYEKRDLDGMDRMCVDWLLGVLHAGTA